MLHSVLVANKGFTEQQNRLNEVMDEINESKGRIVSMCNSSGADFHSVVIVWETGDPAPLPQASQTEPLSQTLAPRAKPAS